jgi:hypothetical protein
LCRFFPLKQCVRLERNCRRVCDEPDHDSIIAEELKGLHCDGVERGDYERMSEYDDEYARKHMPELLSEVASSTIKRLGLKTGY